MLKAAGTWCCWMVIGMSVQAETVVVVAADSPIVLLDKQQVSDLYLGKAVTLKEGGLIQAVDIADMGLRKEFYRQLTGQGLPTIDAYWAQLQFAGRSKPLLRLADEPAVLAYIRRRPRAVGYVSTEALPKDRSVRILLTMN